jgi:hypothetical protein
MSRSAINAAENLPAHKVRNYRRPAPRGDARRLVGNGGAVNPTTITSAPSLVRSLLAATAVVCGLALCLGVLWHRSDAAQANAAPTAVASLHGPAAG